MNLKKILGGRLIPKLIKDVYGQKLQSQEPLKGKTNNYVDEPPEGKASQIFKEVKRNFKEIVATSLQSQSASKKPSGAGKSSGNKEKAKDDSKKKDIAFPPTHPRKIVKVYRYGGIHEFNAKPRMDTFDVDMGSLSGPMVLDLLLAMKKMDPTLTFRKSCRESICGSCAVNLQGSNVLACSSVIPKDKTVIIYPLPHMYVIRDLVVDMDHFIAAYNTVRPYLIRDNFDKKGEIQLAMTEADRDKIDGLYECILCACCATSCPSYWWNGRRFLGPAALLHHYRWVIDARDDYTEERLEFLRDDFKAFRCHTIMNCAVVCPKKLNPAFAIAKLKRLISGLDQKPVPGMNPLEYAKVSAAWLKGKAKFE